MARRRGGYQRPSNGGGASAPGAASQRKVPHLERTGLPYGENRLVNEQQQAAPLNPPTGAPGVQERPTRRGLPQGGPQGIFGPTGRPGEPLTAGVDWGEGIGSPPQPRIGEADDIDLVVRQAYQITRSPHLLRLLDRVVR